MRLKAITSLLFALALGFASTASSHTLDRYYWSAEQAHGVKYYGASDGMIRVAYARMQPETTPSQNRVIVVNKVATYWVKPGYRSGSVTITMPLRFYPVQFYLTSWDVKALERELERLGIKVKPKPTPKPAPVIAG